MATATYPRTALVLPLPTLTHIRDPTPYSHPIRIAVWETTHHLSIIFTHCAPLFSPAGAIGKDRLGAWETLQRFLGCVYGFASQEAMRTGRVVMEVDVVVEGWGGTRGERWVEGQWDRVVTTDVDIKRIFATPPSVPVTSIPPLRPPGQPIIPAPHAHAAHSSTLQEDGKYPVVALGGTFDHLHAGHKILLSMAVWITGRKLIVGVSADDLLVSKAHSEQLEPLALRIERTRAFLRRLEPRLEYDLVELRDVAGPTGTEADVHALVVSRESIGGGDAIAKIREERHFPPLDVFVIDVISSSVDSLIPITDDNADPAQEGDAARSLIGETDQQRLKEGKMSSTYIRKWLAEGGGAAAGEGR